MTKEAFPKALTGIRILDLTRNIAGPVATMMAAEMGADVIKVEPPGGDEMRTWPPFIDGQSVYFISCNRGKRSISLDLKSDEGKALFLDLLKHADVLVENYRPNTLEKLGLGWDQLKLAHPKLVWVSVSGYGRNGPKAQAPAYDSMIQAYSGIMGITGEKDGAPVRSGGSPIDIATSYLAWGAIMTGLHSLQQSGKGLILEVSLMESALGFMHAYLQGGLVDATLSPRMGSETMGMYPMGVFMTQDGSHFLLQVSNETQWIKFCNVLKAQELIDDVRFKTNPDRVKNRDDLRPLIQNYLITKTAQEWESIFTAAGVPASQVRSVKEVISNDQVIERDMIKNVNLPNGKTIKTWGVPIKINEQSATDIYAVPDLNQHHKEIIAELQRLNK
jgi:crotonobetainyl-CoA:carnitine CoA-transferase CaiB-like acyl-CoA transferase